MKNLTLLFVVLFSLSINSSIFAYKYEHLPKEKVFFYDPESKLIFIDFSALEEVPTSLKIIGVDGSAVIYATSDFQAYTYHGVAHRLGDICRILEQKAWAAAKEEYERERKIASVVKEDKVENRFELYEQAVLKSKQAIQLYDDFKLYYQYMIEQFQLFDERGAVRNAEDSKVNLEEAMDVIKLLGHKKANEELKTIKNLMGDLFYFLICLFMSKVNENIARLWSY